MKNIYPILLVFAFLLFCRTGFSQCSASIATSENATQLDCKTTSITLSATTTGAGSVTYSWTRTAAGTEQPAGTTQSITVTDSGLYKVFATGTGCNASSSLRITKNTTAPAVKILAIPGAVCSGSPSTLIATGANTYQWTKGSSSTKDTIIVAPLSSTLYEVRGTSTTNGCSSTASDSLLVNPLPDATISTSKPISCIKATALPTVTFTGTGGKLPYTFSFTIDGGLPVQIKATNKGDTSIRISTGSTDTIVYKLLSVTDGNGCTRSGIQNQSATVSIVNKPALSSPTKNNLCDSTMFYYPATSKNGTVLSWKYINTPLITRIKIDSTNTTIKDVLKNKDANNPQPATYVFFLATGGSNGCIDSPKVSVNVYAKLRLTGTVPNKVCSGVPYSYTPQFTAAFGTFTWSRPPVEGISNSKGTSLKISKGLSVTDTIINTTNSPVDVIYKYNIFNDTCTTDTTVTVTVYPTPHLTSAKNRSVCSGSTFSYTATYTLIAGATITSRTSAHVGGIRGNTGSVIAPATVNDVLVNDSSVALTVRYLFTLLAPGNNCTYTDTVTVTVNPTQVLTSAKSDSVCGGSLPPIPFIYEATSNDVTGKTTFTWTSTSRRPAGNTPRGSGPLISDFLFNDTPDTLGVKYFFTLTNAQGCISTDSVAVIVYPSLSLTGQTSFNVCNGSAFNYDIAAHSSTTLQTNTYTWTSPAIDVINGNTSDTTGKKSVIDDVLTNSTSSPIGVPYYIALEDEIGCRSLSNLVIATVSPPLSKPSLISFSDKVSRNNLSVCASSQNINFNVLSPQSASGGVRYKWTSYLGKPAVDIKNDTLPNTVITFNKPGTDTIRVTATYPGTTCSTSDTQIVKIEDKSSAISNLKIFKKDSVDNILIYPDNTLSSYQWGYDSVYSENPLVTGAPVNFQNQVYQFCIPDSGFIKNDSLNTKDFYYWVLLHNDNTGCDSKIYYNGPFDDLPDAVVPTATGSKVQLQVIPNPNRGVFEIALKGNMYGNVEAQVYSSSGQLVFTKRFVKNVADINEKFIMQGLPPGVYFLIVRSSDMKQARSSFIINP